MFRYYPDYYGSLTKYAKENLGDLGVVKDVSNRNLHFTRWIERFEKIEKKKPLKGGQDQRMAHNNEYNAIMKEVEKLFDAQYTNNITNYVFEVRDRKSRYSIIDLRCDKGDYDYDDDNSDDDELLAMMMTMMMILGMMVI